MTRVAMTLLVGSVILMSAASVATAPTDQSPQESSALLTEVRLLRQAIENLAGNGTRVQLVFGRLQLQEQRTATAARRLEDLRSSVARATNQLTAESGRLKDMEGLFNSGKASPEDVEPLRQMLGPMRREVERLEAERARLAADEADAAQMLAQEQGRWTDLNRQLEELERALLPRR